MADEENEKLAHPSYWDSRYLDSDSTDPEPTHEWFRTYASLTPFFEKHLFTTIPPKHPQPHILHLGSGDSTVPIELHQKGYENQTCIDFSNVVIKKMAKTETEGIKWVMGDVRDMKEQIPDTSVDVAFDKGTLDAMISGSPWDPPDIVVENTTRYINEVIRVLKPNGIFLYITFRQPHFQRKFLAREGLWDLTVESLSDGEGSFEYFGFFMKKR